MAAQAEALAALEAKHEEEWREFRERAETQRQGASKKKLKQIEFALQQEESDLRYRQHEELEELEGGDDAATVEEPAVVEDAAAKRREAQEVLVALTEAHAAMREERDAEARGRAEAVEQLHVARATVASADSAAEERLAQLIEAKRSRAAAEGVAEAMEKRVFGMA